MAIVLPEGLPARSKLLEEGIVVLAREQQRPMSDRALRIALLNLMPDKATTETQLARMLGSTPHLVELTLVVPADYRPKTAPRAHMEAFYRTWPEIRGESFDALIVTGAPVERLPFEAVTYWRELTEILDWAEQSLSGSLFICWAAQAALQHRHGVPKRPLPQKAFGVYRQQVRRQNVPLLQGFGEGFPVPVSRHTEVRAEDLPDDGSVEVLAASPESGLCLLHEPKRRALYMFNHFEYDADTLQREYERDRAAGLPIEPPRNVFPIGRTAEPQCNWRPYAHLFFRNWLDGLAAAAARRRGQQRDLSWMLRHTLGSAPTEGLAEFRVLAQADLDVLPTLLRALASHGVSPLAARTTKDESGLLRIELRLDGMNPERCERMAHLLSGLVGVERVCYRDGSGNGGSFAATAKPLESATTPHSDAKAAATVRPAA